MHLSDLHQHLTQLGAQFAHRQRILRAWLDARPLESGAARKDIPEFLPLAVRQDLPNLAKKLDNLARVRSEHPAADGSVR
ncbi:MAG: rRNA methyltransferase, partial [Pseudomonadales bacterium]|nr:rRNA methyltransferase [Pseudomonadales bacterium]